MVGKFVPKEELEVKKVVGIEGENKYMLYPKNFEQKIGFSEIKLLLHQYCLSNLGHERVDGIEFLTKGADIRMLHARVSEFMHILNESTELPEEGFFDLRESINRIEIKGTHLEEQEMWDLYLSLQTLHGWVEIVRKEDDEKSKYPALSKMADGVFTFYSITKRVVQILDRYGKIKDEASAELSMIRSELRRFEGSVSRTLHGILKSAQAEGLVEKDVAPTLRDGRLVIPVAPALKKKLRGIIHDESATGKTVYIEPAEVVEVNNRIRELKADERREVIRILKEFTALVRPNIKELLRGFEFLADIELHRAKSRLAIQISGITPDISDVPLVDWTLARHPILELSLKRQGKKIVPLEIELHRKQRILIISGPNAGGKSVCLKTVGLLQYMIQCGLPVPLGENSKVGVFRNLFIDIGDEQSIEDDLSTYSSHLLNMKNMMKSCDPSSLLLIDEFGGGTEPTIGGAIAEAVLRRFVKKGTFGVITTHYQNLKHFADDTPGVVNGAMLYDRHRMEALFQLQVGNPGSSFAVEIARKIGIPEDVISDATQMVGQEYINADKYLLDITRDKIYWEGKRQSIHFREKQMEKTIEKYEREISELRERKKEIIRNAQKQAEEIIQNSNARIEGTIREIKEAQAEKERTRNVRQKLEVFREQLQEEVRHSDDELIERKIRQIQERRERKKQRKEKKEREKSEDVKSAKEKSEILKEINAPLQEGDSVRLKGQTTIGIVESVRSNDVTVTFGMMRTVVESKRLERVFSSEKEKKAQTISFVSRETQNQVREKNLQFHQDLDVRGMRGDETIQSVMYFMDDAVLVGASRVRILHGTGSGILRQLIRQYLATIPSVSAYRDEHVQFGGAGITVVDLK